MKKINFGIIGAGNIAEEYLKYLIDDQRVDIKGIIGKSKKNSKKLAIKYKIDFYGNNIDIFLEKDLDVIVVAVNIINTIDVVKKLSRFKGIILFEKPLGINHEETCKIYKILKNIKKKCFVALNRRFYENISFAQNLLNKDKSKKIIQVIDQENLIVAKKLGHPVKIVKNWMYANSIHLIDIILFFGNSKIKKIKNEKFISKNEKIIYSKITFKNKNIAFYYSLWNRPGPWSIDISSSKFFFQFKPIEQLEYRTLKDNKKPFIKKVNKKYKPGFEKMIKAIINFHYINKIANKGSMKRSKIKETNSLVNIKDYIVLSDTIRKIYFKK